MRKDRIKSDFKTSHKIILTILSFMGVLGFTFGIFIFLVLGNDAKSQADTQQSMAKVAEKPVSDAKIVGLKTQAPEKLAHPTQTVQPISDEMRDQVSYTVQSGDSLDAISDKFQTSVASIMQQNTLASPDEIYVGQILNFSRSYVVQADDVAPTTETDSEDVSDDATTSEVSVNNGNKVAAGGLSESERAYVLTELQSRTGVDASQWDYIISRESGWIATIKNSLGYYGLFQLAPGYLGYDGDVQSQIDGAVYLYNSGGMSHWAL